MVAHSQTEMLRHRIYQIMAGFEDADDCDRLCRDGILKMCSGRSSSDEIDLASHPQTWSGQQGNQHFRPAQTIDNQASQEMETHSDNSTGRLPFLFPRLHGLGNRMASTSLRDLPGT